MPATVTGLAAGVPNLVPAPVATEILTKVQEQSVVTRTGDAISFPYYGTALAIQTGHIEAGVVGEGGVKPYSETSYSTKTAKPIKVAAKTAVSEELIRDNPANVWGNIQQDITDAVTRAFDLAVLFGVDASTGQPITSATVEYVNQTSNRVTLGTASKADGGLSADLLAGYNAVIEGDQITDNFSGFAADPRFRSSLLGAVDVNGRPVYQTTINLRDGLDSLFGLPVVYGKAVSGQVAKYADQGVRAFGGDFSALKYGFVQDITVRTSNQATITDASGALINLWDTNQVGLIAEATFGWIITDVNSFAAYEVASGS